MDGQEECTILSKISIAKQRDSFALFQCWEKGFQYFDIPLHMPDAEKLTKSSRQRFFQTRGNADGTCKIGIGSHNALLLFLKVIVECPTKIKRLAEIILANPFIQCFQFILVVDVETELILVGFIQLIHGHANVVRGLSTEGFD